VQGNAARVTATEKIAVLLEDRVELKALVVRLFRHIASATPDSKYLDFGGLESFRALLTRGLDVSTEAFGDLLTDYIRFDFDGNGRLDVTETYKLVKFHLWEYSKHLGSSAAQVDIPCTSLEDAGYRVSKELGKGNFGVVQLAIDRDGNARCIKSFKKSNVSVAGLALIKEEFEAMRLLGCQALAQTFEIFQDTHCYYMVNEVYYGGDFTTLRQRAQNQGVDMTEDWWRGVFRQCLRALGFMHEQAMIHCDIKEPNMMLKTNNLHEPEVVIVDFGLAKAMGSSDSGRFGGTPGYIPPETLVHKKWFPRGDVFSLGVVMFQMLTDRLPSPTLCPIQKGLFLQGCRTMEDVQQATLARQPSLHELPQYQGLTELVAKLLEKQFSLRLKAPQALGDAWIRGSTPTLDDQPPSKLDNAYPKRQLWSKHPMATKGDLSGVLGSMIEDKDDVEVDEHGSPDGHQNDGGDMEAVEKKQGITLFHVLRWTPPSACVENLVNPCNACT
jgi:serine/threonine protein kinase